MLHLLAVWFFALCRYLPAQQKPAIFSTTQFVIGRHSFIDVGPPNDFYELFLVHSTDEGTSVEQITLTPAGDACIQSPKVEVAEGTLSESISALLGKTDPCAISEKELRREIKRCKKCLVFSGANVTMRVQCGARSRIIRADILDKDMFDPAANTPKHTSWTMQLLDRLDHALDHPSVMDRPILPLPEVQETTPKNSAALSDIASGRYDRLFAGAPDKPSDLYRNAQIAPPAPKITLLESSPIQPQTFIAPNYPPLARLARVEGKVTFTFGIDSLGNPTGFTVESGHPMLRGVVEETVEHWKFPQKSAGQRVRATVEFKTNCPPRQ